MFFSLPQYFNNTELKKAERLYDITFIGEGYINFPRSECNNKSSSAKLTYVIRNSRHYLHIRGFIISVVLYIIAHIYKTVFL